MVASSILEAVEACGSSVGALGCDGKDGMPPRREVAPATAATPALYLRKSLLVSLFAVVSVSVVADSTKKLSP